MKVCSGGGSAPGVSSPGVSSPGGSGPGGMSGRGGCDIPACTEAEPPLLTESQTPVKTLPWPNFVAASNKKAFQLNANHPLVKHMGLNMLGRVEKPSMGPRGAGSGPCSGKLLWTDRLTDTTENIIFATPLVGGNEKLVL